MVSNGEYNSVYLDGYISQQRCQTLPSVPSTDSWKLNNSITSPSGHQPTTHPLRPAMAFHGRLIEARLEAVVHQGPIFCSETIVLFRAATATVPTCRFVTSYELRWANKNKETKKRWKETPTCLRFKSRIFAWKLAWNEDGSKLNNGIFIFA